MTYSGSSPILGNGQASAAQIQAWFIARGPGFAPDYAPDGKYKPPPSELGQAIVDEARRFEHVGLVVNHDLVAGQILTETAAAQSRYFRERNNPGGIGSTNDNPDGALYFPTVADGIKVHVAHLLNYAAGFGPWSASDPRTNAIEAAGWLGVAHQIKDLNGKWAFPGTTYGQSIATLANQLLATEAPMSAQIPGFTWHPADSRHFTAGRTKNVVGFAVHYTDGVNSLEYLSTNPGTDVSATFLIRRNATLADRGWQLVKIEDTAHTTGAVVNPKTISFEYEHLENQDIPDGDYAVMAQTVADCRAYLAAHPELGAFSLTRQDVKGHREWVNDSRVCPNGISVDRIVAEAASHGVIIPQDPTLGADPVTGKYVAAEFRDYYDTRGGVDIFGHPKSGAFTEDGRLVQYFERNVFQHFPENAGTPYEVQLRLLGAEELERRYPTGAPA